jgi:hypothetical protein
VVLEVSGLDLYGLYSLVFVYSLLGCWIMLKAVGLLE